jgi:hypothetical protein
MYLNNNQRSQLLAVLQKNEHIFMGIRGTYAGPPVDIKLKPNAIPVWNRPYPIPLSQREAVENEVKRQCQVGALRRLSPEEIKGREWCFPAFGVPKKNGKICFVINFSENHIHGRAGIMQPITKLMKKSKPFVWEVEQQEAFDKIKKVISEAILLTYPDPSKRLHIFPDASSKHAMGAVCWYY